jgi:hypothetical protein
MKKIPLISLAFLLTLASATCSAQKAQAPSSDAAVRSKKQAAPAPPSKVELAAGLVPKIATKKKKSLRPLLLSEVKLASSSKNRIAVCCAREFAPLSEAFMETEL